MLLKTDHGEVELVSDGFVYVENRDQGGTITYAHYDEGEAMPKDVDDLIEQGQALFQKISERLIRR